MSIMCKNCLNLCKRAPFVQNFKGKKWAAAARACIPHCWCSNFSLRVFNSESNGGVEIALSLKLRKLRTILLPHPPSWKRYFWIDLILRCFKWCLALDKMKTGRGICLIRSDSIQVGFWSRNELWMVKKLQFQEKYLYINEKYTIGRAGFVLRSEGVNCNVEFK